MRPGCNCPGHRFNPRSRMESDGAGNHLGPVTVVSIHALAWRATRVRTLLLVGIIVSIHALAWRATVPFSEPAPLPVVSIHALAWRATGQELLRQGPDTGFNPRSRMESDQSYQI